jgi:ADP-heptose:LPS heptosyltransferase
MPSPPCRPLIVRLRNWVGDVTLGVPTLQRLADSGYDLRLIGKGWAADLLAGHGWPVEVLAKTFGDRVRQLRRLRADALAADPGFGRRLNAACFPYSFGSALEMRLAGLKAIGHAYEGRGLLLGRCVARPQRVHELEVYWHLGSALLGQDAPPPPSIGLRLAPRHLEQAAALRERHGIAAGYIVICPFAGGTWSGEDKTWPDFAGFVSDELASLGRPIVVCPGPGEEDAAREHFAAATLLPGVGLGAYAALLQQSALMISNDTGPGHMAAAVGAPLLSVLGPSDPALWRAWGPGVRLLKGADGWPSRAQAATTTAEILAAPR